MTEKSKVCDKLLEEANKKLEKALKTNDLIEANVAKSMLESARVVKMEQEKLGEKQESCRTMLIRDNQT